MCLCTVSHVLVYSEPRNVFVYSEPRNVFVYSEPRVCVQ